MSSSVTHESSQNCLLRYAGPRLPLLSMKVLVLIQSPSRSAYTTCPSSQLAAQWRNSPLTCPSYPDNCSGRAGTSSPGLRRPFHFTSASSITYLPRLDLRVGTTIAFEFGCPKHVVNVLKGIDANSRASPEGNKAKRGSGRHWPSSLQLGHGCMHHTFTDHVHSGCFPPTCLPERLKG